MLHYYFSVLCLIVYQMAEGARPLIRSRVARTLYNKMTTDHNLRNMDFEEFYKVDHSALSTTAKETFLQLHLDAETQRFLDNCFEQSEWIFVQMWQSLAKSFLGLFLSQTSVNGLLNRGRMFVWSTEQAKALLNYREDEDFPVERTNEEAAGSLQLTLHAEAIRGKAFLEPQSCPAAPVGADGDLEGDDSSNAGEEALWWGDKLILDLGAGDGYVTQILGHRAKEVHVTETSPVMRKRLRDRGYRVLDAFSWPKETNGIHYDVITCLNLLDRCDAPKTLLRDAWKRLAENGKLVIALVLPFSSYVETGTADHEPSEPLNITGTTTEEQVTGLIENAFPELGFRTLSWSKVPYLCEGDVDQAFYWLPDLIFVLQKIDVNSS